MKVIVTGASGFIGRRLCKKLKELDYDVLGLSSLDADLTIQGSLKKYSNIKFDKIFHLAAWTQAGDFCLYHSGDQWIFNQQINTNILEWWKNYQPQAKLISFGTSCSYPETGVLTENRYLSGQPVEGLYSYAMTKRMLLVGQKSLNKQYNLNYLTVIPSTVFGPGYYSHGKQLHFIFDLIRKALEYKYLGKDIILWGDGEQRRELVYIDDFISELLKLDKVVNNDIVNIGAGIDFSISEFMNMICNILSINPSVVKYDTNKYVGAKSKKLDNKKLDSILKNRKRLSLEEGLRNTIKWMENILKLSE
jgi:GDP-L-fucose synthase